jgi:WD40 repeat protein
LAVGVREAVLWRDVTTGSAPKRYSNDYVTDAALDSTGTHLITGTMAGVHVHDLTTGTAVELAELRTPETIENYCVFNASSIEPIFIVHQLHQTVSGWRIEPAGGATRLWLQLDEDSSRYAEFFSDGSRFVHGEFRGWQVDGHQYWLIIRNSENGEVLQEVRVPEDEYPSDEIVVSPDGLWIGYSEHDTLLVRESVGDWRIIARVSNSTGKWFTDLAFHPSGRFLAATSNDTMVKLYDTASWQEARTFTWNIGRLRSVAFSPDGLLAAAGSDTGKIVVWDVDV